MKILFVWIILLLVIDFSCSFLSLQSNSRRTMSSPLPTRGSKSLSICAASRPVEDYVCVPREELLRDVLDTPVRAELLLNAERVQKLRNRYIGYRHGQSNANIAGIISSDYETGCFVGEGDHGLTDLGKSQAREATEVLLDLVGKERFKGDVLFVSSPFSRAKQTTEETQLELQSKWGLEVPMEIDEGLRERYFGEFDQLDLIFYNKVWPVDLVDSENTRYGVESVAQVCERVLRVISKLEERYENKVCVLTSHADTLQIAQTLFSGEDPRYFSQHRFKNCEARELIDIGKRVPLEYK
jgi:broad specificity phosphatase PhoE